MQDTVEGVIISERAYGETSKILNIITKEHGIIGVLAKGAKTMKSNLRSVTTKLTYGTFYIYYKENKLSILSNVDIINNFRNIQKDIEKISYATFILELAEQVIKQNNSSNIYDLFISSLVKINEGFDPQIITNILELKLLSFLGVAPVIDECYNCGAKTGIATLSADKGGYICNKCYQNEVKVSDKTIKLIRMFYYIDISKIEKIDISSNIKKEINTFLDEYYDKYTGLYLKSKSLIKNINRIS